MGKILSETNICKLLSFIDHSFEERRKILKRKQREGSIIDMKVLEYLQKRKTLKMTFFLDQSFGIRLK